MSITPSRHDGSTFALDAAQAGDSDRPELRQALEEIVESGFVGVSLRVRDERGEWTGSAGAAELGGTAKPSPAAHVRIGSNTKTFTATLVLQLVAEGRVELDAPVAGYLPEFGLDERITVRMLLQHTSGLFNFTGEVNPDGTVALGIPMPYGPRGEEWLDSRFTAYQPGELVKLALSRPARFEPGTGWSYSNTNYVLARLLIEKITGRSAAEETRLRIAEPLGLSGTLLPDGPEIPEPHAHAYYRHEVGGEQQTVDITRQDPSWVSAGGDMISTTEDLAVFVSALLSGKLLPPELVAQMCAPHPTGIPNMDYGLGVFVLTTENGGTVISHNGAQGGHAALLYSTPDGSKTLTAALNCVDDAGMSIAAAFQSVQHQLLREVF